jgi:hypothetical protein
MGCCLICSLLLPNLLVLGRFRGVQEPADDEDAEFEDDLDDDDSAGEPSTSLAA